jgi:hypothetical protein
VDGFGRLTSGAMIALLTPLVSPFKSKSLLEAETWLSDVS